MITVSEAMQIIMQASRAFGTEEVPLSESQGRILREDLVADRDFPPYHRVTMDGIAISYAAWERGQREFPIQEIAAAGKPQVTLSDHDLCLEVMTGAIAPEGCDTIIRYEDTQIDNGSAKITVDTVKRGQNIHRQAEDRNAGDIIVRSGCRMTAAEIGVAATVGKTRIKVAKAPGTCLISSGDELVGVDEIPQAHQIRRSNMHSVAALLTSAYVNSDMIHVPDDEMEIQRALQHCLSSYDVLIMSGGVSMGKYDYFPKLLTEAGVKQMFHKVRQRPGKPFWFGQSDAGQTVFALPGNPVSTFACTLRYVLPWLATCMGSAPTAVYATLDSDITFKPDLTYFVPVRLSSKNDGDLLAVPSTGHGSGDLASLVDADGFLELPHGREVYEKGESFRVWRYR